jgi:hypothetical protein
VPLSQQLPNWLLSDWIVVLISALVILFATAIVCAFFGAVLAVTSTSSFGTVASGALRGIYLTFACFGVKTAAGSAVGDNTVLIFGSSFLLMPGVLIPMAATWIVLRSFALPRVRDGLDISIAFVVKLALVCGVFLSIAAALMSVGHVSSISDSEASLTSDLVAKVAAGSAFLYAFLIVGIVALALMMRASRIVITGRARDYLDPIGQAAKTAGLAYLVLAVGAGALATLGAVIVADSGAQRLTIIASAPLILVNVGISAVSVAMGGSVRFATVNFLSGGSFGFDTSAGATGHVSLMKFGFPPASDAGSAPIFWFVLLLVPLVVLGWFALRELDRARPATEQGVLGIGLRAGIGFALIAWLGGLLGRIEVAGFGLRAGDGNGDGVAGVLVWKPSVGAALGLGLVWGLVGAVGAALWWGSARGVRWTFLQQVGGSSQPSTPPPPASSVPAPSPAAPVAPTMVAPPSPPPPPAAAPTVASAPPQPAPAAPTPPATGANWWSDTATVPSTPPPEPTQPVRAAATPTPAFCTNCGQGLDPNNAFCISCGAPAG